MRAGDVVQGRFFLEREVAEGGMGKVFFARDRQTGRAVALKTLLRRSQEDRARFALEASSLAALEHPAIVRHVDHGETAEGDPFLAMDWLEGIELTERLRRGPLPFDDVVALGGRVASALGALHRRGLIHRDLKPSNILLLGGRAEDATLLDLGVVRPAESAAPLTRTGVILGTPHYMAPEQARGERELDARVDLFALGSVLFECVTGRPAFAAGDLLAVLARILLESPPRLRDVRPETPERLEALVARLLEKSPEARHADGDEVARALLDVAAASSGGAPPSLAARPGLTAQEKRVLCLLVAGRGDVLDATLAAGERDPIEIALRAAAARHDARLEPLADGSTLVVLGSGGVATDQAARAARIALEVRAASPGVPLAIATGRAESAGTLPVGEVALRLGALRRIAGGAIRVDETTAGLVEGRFELGADAAGTFLRRERDDVGPRRKLLNRHTPCVGRDRELGMLDGLLSECFAESGACAALVTAPAGAGKSRLLDELLARVRAEAARGAIQTPALLLGRGDAVSRGSSFGMLGQAIRRAAGIVDGEPLAARRDKLAARLRRRVPSAEVPRLAELLGELCGVPAGEGASDAILALRRDPVRMGDVMRTAWEEWLEHECGAQPVLLVLDDLHWGDMPTVRYVDGALRRLRRRPLMVLALARPEVHKTFPNLWQERELHQVHLSRLGARAAERLVREVLEDVTDDALAWILERYDGNAFYLEELIRAVASGADRSVPDSVTGMLEARFDALDEPARRALRAGSVFGETFWAGGVAELIAAGDLRDVARALDDLEARELIERRRSTRMRDQAEYAFRHALVRDAAYAMLTDDDRRLGHRLAGQWLERRQEVDPLVMAEHFALGGEPALAVRRYKEAAEQALAGNDFEAAIARVERGVRCGAAGELLAALRLVETLALRWAGRNEEAAARGEEAARLFAPGSSEWYRAAAEVIVARGRMSQREELCAWVEEVRRASPRPGCAPAQLIALCRSIVPLTNLGEYALTDLAIEQATTLAATLDSLDPIAEAQLEEARGERGEHAGDYAVMMEAYERSARAWERAGEERDLSLVLATYSWVLSVVGELERAEASAARALSIAERLASRPGEAWARGSLAVVHFRARRNEEAIHEGRRSATSWRDQRNLRHEGFARIILSHALLASGRAGEADDEATEAIRMLGESGPVAGWARAVRARALVALARPDDALLEAGAARRMAKDHAYAELVSRVAEAEALLAAGEQDAARDALLLLGRRVEEIGARLSGRHREGFHRDPIVATALALMGRFATPSDEAG